MEAQMSKELAIYTAPSRSSILYFPASTASLERELKELECSYYIAIRRNESFTVIKEYYSRIKQLKTRLGK